MIVFRKLYESIGIGIQYHIVALSFVLMAAFPAIHHHPTDFPRKTNSVAPQFGLPWTLRLDRQGSLKLPGLKPNGAATPQAIQPPQELNPLSAQSTAPADSIQHQNLQKMAYVTHAGAFGTSPASFNRDEGLLLVSEGLAASGRVNLDQQSRNRLSCALFDLISNTAT